MNMNYVLIYTTTVYEDDIQVDKYVVVKCFPEDLVYEMLEDSWSIHQSEWHYEVLVMARGCDECCLSLAFLVNSNWIIGTVQVQLGKDVCLLWPRSSEAAGSGC